MKHEQAGTYDDGGYKVDAKKRAELIYFETLPDFRGEGFHESANI